MKFIALNKELINLLLSLGFKKHQMNIFTSAGTKKEYYVNEDGCQFRLDFNSGTISLLDKKGYTLFTDKSISTDRIRIFIERKV